MANVPAGATGTDSASRSQNEQVYGLVRSAESGLTALAGGAQAGTALQYAINRFTTVATGGDSAQLPPATVGREVIVINAGASSMNVFPQTGEAIDAGAANAARAVANAKTCIFFCAVAGTWNSLLGA